jgi:hypothetical protein
MYPTFLQLPLAIGFITPAFAVAGAALVGIPILIHILNRRRFKIVHWAAMDYLLQAMRKNRRRLKFEQWILLATRCLLLFLLGLALSRPLGCEDSLLGRSVGQHVGVHAFIVDNSYSMAYEADRGDAKTHLDQAKKLTKAMIDRLSDGESVILVTAAYPATPVIAKPTYNLTDAKSAVDRIEQAYTDTDMAGALQKTLELARDETKEPKRVLHILSDGTRSAWPASKQEAIAKSAQELAKVFKIVHHNLGKVGQWNQVVADVQPVGNLVTQKLPYDFKATVAGYGPGPDVLIQWKLDDKVLSGGQTLKLTEKNDPITYPGLQFKEGGLHVLSASLLSDNRLKIDDTRYHVVDVASELKVLIVEGDRGMGGMSGSASSLALALAPPSDASSNGPTARSDSAISPEVASDIELGNKVLGEYRAVILTNVAQFTTAQAQQMATYVQQGGTILWFMGNQVNSKNYNEVLLPHKLLPGPIMKLVSVSPEQNGYLFDFRPKAQQHPFLEVFRDIENSGLNTAEVRSYLQVEIPADANVEHVLDYLPLSASADGKAPRPAADAAKDGQKKDPAITMHTVGRGRVVYVSTTANAEWTTFPAKPAYLPLMQELLRGSVITGDKWMNVTAGQAVNVPTGIKLTAVPVLTDPAQKQIVMEQKTIDGQPVWSSQTALAKPGIYTLNTGSQTIPIAVNVAAEEADIRLMDNSLIKKAMGGIDLGLESDQIPAESLSRDTSNDFGWNFMIVVLLLAGAECFLAMYFGHYKRKAPIEMGATAT